MKLKNNTIIKRVLAFVSVSILIIKRVLTFVAVCMLVFGGVGFCSKMGSVSSCHKYYKQYPLNDKNGIAVDSEGNIYIGEGETESIQVYDSLGNFQYGFSFPTGGGGWFAFGIKEDKINIVTARTDSYFIFDKGELIYSEKEIGYNRCGELETEYHMTAENTFSTGSKTYDISSLNIVSVEDKSNGKVEKIHLDVPVWPFSAWVFWRIAAIGMIMFFVLNPEFCPSRVNKHKKGMM
ncbi:MAG: hypothetical protein N4A57_09900 [Anaeromicrobium sp.]|jgi:hypothetical protein|uniref:hypothetical protein n=1 Tax=Anaeromicrobium sp. TaxID=1929132 RepID=UPI0025FC55EF|nr:hypothetical protein [Anaeromicrobium sp.]MCT4594562.1 hypothetical protein [Anaeromicrobium sp.]